MALTLTDLTTELRASREHLLKHLEGLPREHWAAKPHPECKSVIETLSHLIVDDKMALGSLRTGQYVNYDVFPIETTDPDQLLELLKESHEELIAYLEATFAEAPLDAPVCVWGNMRKLAIGIAFLSSEDHYHAGQIAYLRMAIEPEWDYYGTIYG